MLNLMKGKKGLVLGVANEHSIAWSISKVLSEQGAELAFTYQNEQTGSYVIPLFQSIQSQFYEVVDLTNPEDVSAMIEKLDNHFHGELDFVVQLLDRKSTRLNSSHPSISYAVFCLKKKKPTYDITRLLT